MNVLPVKGWSSLGKAELIAHEEPDDAGCECKFVSYIYWWIIELHYWFKSVFAENFGNFLNAGRKR